VEPVLSLHREAASGLRCVFVFFKMVESSRQQGGAVDPVHEEDRDLKRTQRTASSQWNA